jgi:hypothetical protein
MTRGVACYGGKEGSEDMHDHDGYASVSLNQSMQVRDSDSNDDYQ